jgi:hypothetical protein
MGTLPHPKNEILRSLRSLRMKGGVKVSGKFVILSWNVVEAKNLVFRQRSLKQLEKRDPSSF